MQAGDFTGIDLSEWQEPQHIDYDALARNTSFVILRLGFTGSKTGNTYIMDQAFEHHYEELSKRNVPIGIYWYSCADSESKAVREAKHVLRLLEGKNISWPIFWDTEDTHYQDKIDAASLTKVGLAFCHTIEEAGYRSGVYASMNWCENHLQLNQFTNQVLWLAYYSKDKPPIAYDIWQYTNEGTESYYKGALDINRSRWNYAVAAKD